MKRITGSLTVCTLGSLASLAQASILTATFNIDCYTCNGGGKAGAYTTEASLSGKTVTGSGTYSGALYFFKKGGMRAPTVNNFLTSIPGNVAWTLTCGKGKLLMTASNYATTTLFVFSAVFATGYRALSRTMTGSAFMTMEFSLRRRAPHAAPTGAAPTSYSWGGGAGGNDGAFRLIHSAANGNPEVVNVSDPVVPLPAAAWLFG